MMYLLLCIFIKLTATDLHMNIKRKAVSLLSLKLLFYTTFFVNLNNKDHEAFLVNELMPNIQEISEKHGLKQPQAELRLRIETERKTSRSFSL